MMLNGIKITWQDEVAGRKMGSGGIDVLERYQLVSDGVKRPVDIGDIHDDPVRPGSPVKKELGSFWRVAG
jgi:hypothetical protein